MSKILRIDFTSPHPIADIYAGEIGEHNEVFLEVIPETGMTENADIDFYFLHYAVNGGVLPSSIIPKGEQLIFALGGGVTSQPTLECQLIAQNDEGTLVVKSPVVRLVLGNSVQGDIIDDPYTGDTIYSQVAEILDTFTPPELADEGKVFTAVLDGEKVKGEWQDSNAFIELQSSNPEYSLFSSIEIQQMVADGKNRFTFQGIPVGTPVFISGTCYFRYMNTESRSMWSVGIDMQKYLTNVSTGILLADKNWVTQEIESKGYLTLETLPIYEGEIVDG